MMRPIVSSAPEKGYLHRTYADMLGARGAVLLAAKQYAGAITEFENARSIYVSLFKPNSAAYHASVAACDVKLGEVSMVAGQDRSAETYFRRALATVSLLIASQPPDLDALYAAADDYAGLGLLSIRKAKKSAQAAEQKQNWADARSWYEKSLSTWQRVGHPNHMAPNGFQAGDPARCKKQLEVVEKALASLHSRSLGLSTLDWWIRSAGSFLLCARLSFPFRDELRSSRRRGDPEIEDSPLTRKDVDVVQLGHSATMRVPGVQGNDECHISHGHSQYGTSAMSS